MDVNFLPCVLDQRSLLPPAWQDWLPRGGSGLVHPRCGGPEGSTTNAFRVFNRFGDAFIPYRAQPSLTCQCRMGDNCGCDV